MSTTGEASQVSPWRAAWLLSRLRLRRQWNQIRSASLFRGASPARTGTRRKSSLGWIFTAFVILAMVGNFANMAHWGMANLEKALGSVEVYKEVQRGWLGVQVGPVTADIASRLGVVPSRGAVINSMAEAGPAKSAGLQAQDVIVSFDARQVRDANDLSRMASATPVGKNVEVVFIRAGAQQRKIVTLGTLPEDAQPSVRAIAPAPGTVLAPGVLHGAAIEVMLLGLATLFVVLASREIVQPEWDLEWLVTLPLPLSTLLLGRLVERAVTNSAGILILGPFLSVIAWECGLRWSAPLVGIGFTFALLFVVATFQTLVDTGLRLSLPPPKLRNLQAVISLVSMLPMLLAFSIAMPGNSLLLDWVPALPGWIDVLPTGLAVRALAAADGSSMALWSAAMLGEIAAFVAIGYAVLQRQLRYGVVATGGREAVARRPREKRDAGGVLRGAQALLSAVQRRELILLGRDRTFMVQTLVLPVVVVGTQVFLNARTNILAAAIEHPENLAAIAFALPAYMLMLSAFQTLNAEGQALWILYAVPQPLELILRQKARLWAAAAMIYPLIILAVAVGVSGQVTVAFAGSAAIVLVGVPIFAVIATALGVFGCDPLATEVHRRIRLTYSYLYMLLVSLYVYAVYASTIWQRAATVILTALLALALWQKARDRFDYLLDPTASPAGARFGVRRLDRRSHVLRRAGARHRLLSGRQVRHSSGSNHLDRILHRGCHNLWRDTVRLLAHQDRGCSAHSRPRLAAGPVGRGGRRYCRFACWPRLHRNCRVRGLAFNSACHSGRRPPLARGARDRGGTCLRGVHFPRFDIRWAATLARAGGGDARQCRNLCHRASADVGHSGVLHGDLRRRGLRTYQGAGRRDGRPCGLQCGGARLPVELDAVTREIVFLTAPSSPWSTVGSSSGWSAGRGHRWCRASPSSRRPDRPYGR